MSPDALLFELPDLAEAKRCGRLNNSGEFRWYTPSHVIERARVALGEIDLDPASDDVAQRIVKAKRYFSTKDNGLTQEWKGRVWLNPPFTAGIIDRFISKLCSHYEHPQGGVSAAILLTNNSADTSWFRLAGSRSAVMCFPYRRIRFLKNGVEEGSPVQGQTLFYYGQHPERFKDAFGDFGFFTKWDPYERHDLLSAMGVGR